MFHRDGTRVAAALGDLAYKGRSDARASRSKMAVGREQIDFLKADAALQTSAYVGGFSAD